MGLGLLNLSTAHPKLHVADYSTNNSALVGYSTNLSQMRVHGGKDGNRENKQMGMFGKLIEGRVTCKQGNETRNAQVLWTWEGAEMVCVRRGRCEHD